MSNLPRPDRAYPVALEGDEDSRFTTGLTLDVADVLARHDYPPLGALDIVQLRQALFRFIYGGARTGYMAEPAEEPRRGAAYRAARKGPILCAHADEGGTAHWLQPGQPCDRARQGGGLRGGRTAPKCSGCDSDTVVTHTLGDGLLQVAVFHDDACPVLSADPPDEQELRRWINAGFLDHTHARRTRLLTLLQRSTS